MCGFKIRIHLFVTDKNNMTNLINAILSLEHFFTTNYIKMFFSNAYINVGRYLSTLMRCIYVLL